MTRPKAITISQPFDARHVAGVGIPGTTQPLQGVSRTFASTIEPDEIPTHLNMSSNAPPKRSTSLARSLSRPSLRLKSSLSMLRGRSSSHPPPEAPRHQRKPSDSERAKSPERQHLPPPPPPPVLASIPIPSPILELQPSPPRLPPKPRTPPKSTLTTQHRSQPQRQPQSQSQSQRQSRRPETNSTTRPKRADSGTAIDFDRDNVPLEIRPLGFKEIMAVKNFDERMALYAQTREYWACADHGLGDWVGGHGQGHRARGVRA